MSIQQIPFRLVRRNWPQALVRGIPMAATLGLLILAACGGPSTSGESATLSGTVTAAGSSAPIAAATVKAGTRQATSDANGRFELTDVPIGAATVRAERQGYLPVDAAVTITAGTNSHDFTLSVQEVYVSGAYAMYVPATGGPLRGVILSLGGGVTTSGFVTGGNLEGSGELEQSLQALGADLRALAKSAHVAVFGTTTLRMANSAFSDNDLFAALSDFAGLSGHAELANAPVLMFGLDAGSLEGAGLASRHPERSIGVLMRVPTEVPVLTEAAALAVPTFVMQAALDAQVNNLSIQSTFLANRSRGALWALAVEPGIGHAVATANGNAANVDWIATALTLRLPATPGNPLIAMTEPAGWLGDQGTLEISSWANYPGNRAAASWLLSQSAAMSWKALGTTPGGGGGQGSVRSSDH